MEKAEQELRNAIYKDDVPSTLAILNKNKNLVERILGIHVPPLSILHLFVTLLLFRSYVDFSPPHLVPLLGMNLLIQTYQDVRNDF